MPPVNLLIKPASGNCNMRCSYCFYKDVTERRDIPSYGIMSHETLENVMEKALQFADKECTIAFQGGEPTLAGRSFFKDVVTLQKKHNVKNLTINNAIQTNGLLLDDEWCTFFSENGFLVGLSVDGNKSLHDGMRKDAAGEGTYIRVAEAAARMDRLKVDYNILTVVTGKLAAQAYKVYQHYKKNGWRYLQFIPCIDPFEGPHGAENYSLSPEAYADFLKLLFDLWYNDLSHGEFVSIRLFDNFVGMLRGCPPESCGMLGHCTMQYVIEADGSVYPCDFYVTDEYRLGELNQDSFEAIDKIRREIRFIEQSPTGDPACRACRWYPLCRGGCRRDRETADGLGRNCYCRAYQAFFPYAIERLERLAGRR